MFCFKDRTTRDLWFLILLARKQKSILKKYYKTTRKRQHSLVLKLKTRPEFVYI